MKEVISLGLKLFGRNFCIRLILEAAQFQVPMRITELMVFPNTSFYVCPNCKITLEREYSRFCDRCGQRLDWKDCRHARIVYPGAFQKK